MDNRFLIDKFINSYNERVELIYQLKQRDDNILEFKYEGIHIILNNEFNLFINDKLTTRQDIKIKKGILKKKLYYKDQKLNISKKSLKYLEVILRNIWGLNIGFNMYEYHHSLVSREKKFKEKYILLLKDTLLNYSLDTVYVYKYIYDLIKSMNFKNNEIEILINKDVFNKDIFNNDFEYILFLNDFYYFFILYNFDIPKNFDLNKLNKENQKIINKLIKNIYSIDITNYGIDNTNNYLLTRQIYLNMMKKNELDNIGGYKMFEEKKEFFIEFKNEKNEKNVYSVNVSEENGEYIVEYFSSLKNEKNPILIIGSDRIDLNDALNYKLEDLDLDKKKSLEKKYITIGKILRNIKFKEEEDINYPSIKLLDVTERKVLGFNEINTEFLRDKGIWINHGNRYFEVILENILGYFQENSGYKIEFNLYLTRVGNEKLDQKALIKKNYTTNLMEDNPNNDFIFEFNLDTDYLYELLRNKFDDKYINTAFEIEISFTSNLKDFKIIYPFELKLKDSKEYISKDGNNVFMDFGTSSTCVAYYNSEMITLESIYDNDKSRIFENPTNLMINNWESFSEHWLKEDYPNIERMSSLGENNRDFIQGYKLLNGGINREILNATIDKIKLIPYNKFRLNERMKFRAIIDNEKEISLVTGDKEKENEKNFKPIVTYAYLLGRNIMSPKRNTSTEISDEEIPIKFIMTTPTKFDLEIREIIRQDIERGLKLAAPRNIKDLIKVEIGNEEPVAFVGAMLQKSQISTGDKFAIFDMGGGTLDFAFGIYREATETEEEEEIETVLEIYNTDGNERGGIEHLINRVSYQIYKGNESLMKENKIPFILPIGEEKIEFFPENLLHGKSTTAYLNLKSLNEYVTRRIIINDDDNPSETIELKDIDNLTKSISITVDISSIKDYIREYLTRTVDSFIKMIQRDIPEPYTNLKIFRAGNGSKNKMLEEILTNRIRENEKLSNTGIYFVNEKEQNGISPKTAVVLGEVNFRRKRADIKIVYNNKIKGQENQTAFEFYVGRQDKQGSDKFIELINKGNTSREWKEYGFVSREDREKDIYYSNIEGIESIRDTLLKRQVLTFTEDEMYESKKLWIRANSGNKIEYIFSKKQPIDNVEGTIVELKR